MKPVILDSMLRIPLESLSPDSRRKIAAALTLRLPDNSYGGAGPATLSAWKVEGQYLCVPRNWDAAKQIENRMDVLDQRAYGSPIDLKFLVTFRQGQKDFIARMLSGLVEDDRGVIGRAGCGFGKTVCATAAIAELNTTTLFVVHKEKLMTQFIEACEKFLGYRPGVIQGDTCDWRGKKICVGMIQSLHQRDYDPMFYSHFGLVMVDECHRVAAPTFSDAISKFHARYRIGLTATPRRGDNMEDIFFWHLGDVAAVGKGQFLDCTVTVVEWESALKPSSWMFRGRPLLGRLITALSKEDSRTNMIVELIAQATRSGRKSLVLSDRTEHLEAVTRKLRKIFATRGEGHTADVFVAGGTKKAIARRASALKSDVMSGTWAMASEGLDAPERDTVFFITPKADIEQAAGRIRRLWAGKKQPMIVDVFDQAAAGVLRGLFRKRSRFYRDSSIDKRPWPVRTVQRFAS